jgi:hypothetical protein
VLNESAPPGKELKYARPERERRFLFDGVPDGLAVRAVLIVDRYLPGTRIRLRQERKLTASSGEPECHVFKLTQKVPEAGGGPGLMTTMYLNSREYAVLSRVPAVVLQKTRLSIPPFGIDVFEGELSGLVLGEAEFDDDASLAAFEPPIPLVAEVTQDRRLTGGEPARTSRQVLADVLAEYGVAVQES